MAAVIGKPTKISLKPSSKAPWQLVPISASPLKSSSHRSNNRCRTSFASGTVNGVAASCSFLTRIVSPVVCGFVLSWSSAETRPFPLNFYFVFLTLASTIGGAGCLLYFVPKSFDKRLESSASTTAQPGSTTPLPGSSVELPGSSAELPGSSAELPGSTTAQQGSPYFLPGSATSRTGTGNLSRASVSSVHV